MTAPEHHERELDEREHPAARPEPPRTPQAWSGGTRGTFRNEDAPPGPVPGERALANDAMRPVGQRARGAGLVSALVVGAFLLGLVRPWDWLAGSRVPAPDHSGASQPAAGLQGGAGAPATTPPAPAKSLTCASPLAWRSATIESWSGRQARVWTAANAVTATGPGDPAIPFLPVIAETVTAIGWCAPVEGPDRPPFAARAQLFRITDGVAAAVPFERLEPREPDALGELWVPPALSVGRRPPWSPGRYVIRLAAGTGAYVRYLGLEVMDRLPPRAPTPPSPGVATPGVATPVATAAPATTQP